MIRILKWIKKSRWVPLPFPWKIQWVRGCSVRSYDKEKIWVFRRVNSPASLRENATMYYLYSTDQPTNYRGVFQEFSKFMTFLVLFSSRESSFLFRMELSSSMWLFVSQHNVRHNRKGKSFKKFFKCLKSQMFTMFTFVIEISSPNCFFFFFLSHFAALLQWLRLAPFITFPRQ